MVLPTSHLHCYSLLSQLQLSVMTAGSTFHWSIFFYNDWLILLFSVVSALVINDNFQYFWCELCLSVYLQKALYFLIFRLLR